MRIRSILIPLAFCPLPVSQARALNIIPTFVDSSDQAWTDTQKSVVLEAIGDWEKRILDNQTINVSFDLTHAAAIGATDSVLARWAGTIKVLPPSVYPWTPTVQQVIEFNQDLMNPSLPNQLEFTAGVVAPGDWDGLSVTRHELCHMLGFTQYFYWQGHTDKWSIHVSGTTFNPGGLNVQMDNAIDVSNVADSGPTAGDLMTPTMPNGVRKQIGATDLKMLEVAYHYAMIPGDLDRDGKVDFSDLAALARSYGQSNATWDSGDFNNDGTVGFDDLTALARNYGETLDTYGFGLSAGAASQPTAAQLGQPTPTVRADVEAAFAEIPEPRDVSVLLPIAAAMVRRRTTSARTTGA